MYNNFSSKKTKKVISALLATALVATSAPISADAATAKVVGVGKTITYNAKAKVKKVTVKNKKIVTAKKSGKKVTIKGKKAGKTTVTIKTTKKTVKLTVKVGATKIAKKTVTTSMKVGETKALKVTATNGKGDTIKFTSSDKATLKVNKASAKANSKKVAGTTVTALKAGKAKITATSKYTGKKKAFTITVVDATPAVTPSTNPAVVATTPAVTNTTTPGTNPGGSTSTTKAPTTTSGAATNAPSSTDAANTAVPGTTNVPGTSTPGTSTPEETKAPQTTSGTSTTAPTATEAPEENVKAALKDAYKVSDTKVQVNFSNKIEAPTTENFTIEGLTISAAELTEDQKSVILTVSEMEVDKTYTVAVKNIVDAEGEAVADATVEFAARKIQYVGKIEVVDVKTGESRTQLRSDGQDSAKIIFTLMDDAGNVVKDNAEVQFTTTAGNFAENKVAVQSGVATNLFTSEISATQKDAYMTATVVSAENKELLNLTCNKTISMTPSVNTEKDESVGATLTDVMVETCDRVILYFNKDVNVTDYTKNELTTGDVYTYDASKMEIAIVDNAGTATSVDGLIAKTPVALAPVPGETKALYALLAEGDYLTDNSKVVVKAADLTKSLKVEETKSAFVTDIRTPSMLSVTNKGLTQIKITFSEPIQSGSSTNSAADLSKWVIDNTSLSNDKYGVDGARATATVGTFNKETGEDNRNVVTITLGKDKDGEQIYFKAGNHSVQGNNIGDWANMTDEKNNIINTQTLDFIIEADETAPTATVEVESPEQFYLKFNTSVSLNALQTNLKLQQYKDGAWVDVPNSISIREIDETDSKEYIVELNKDWTNSAMLDTKNSNKNYYNYKFRLSLAKDTITNVLNGLKNAEINLNLDSKMMTEPDVTSPEMAGVFADGKKYVIIDMSEPVQIDLGGTYERTLTPTIEQGATLATPTVQFISSDNSTTINGKIVKISEHDNQINVEPESNLTPGTWKVVVRNVSDDIGNTATTLVKDDFVIEGDAVVAETGFMALWAVAVPAKKDNPITSVNEKDTNETESGTDESSADDVIYVKFNKKIKTYGASANAGATTNYTVNGYSVPSTSKIESSVKYYNETANLKNSYNDLVAIHLPAGTLTGKSNTINISQTIESAAGAKLSNGGIKLLSMVDKTTPGTADYFAWNYDAYAVTAATDLTTAQVQTLFDNGSYASYNLANVTITDDDTVTQKYTLTHTSSVDFAGVSVEELVVKTNETGVLNITNVTAEKVTIDAPNADVVLNGVTITKADSSATLEVIDILDGTLVLNGCTIDKLNVTDTNGGAIELTNATSVKEAMTIDTTGTISLTVADDVTLPATIAVKQACTLKVASEIAVAFDVDDAVKIDDMKITSSGSGEVTATGKDDEEITVKTETSDDDGSDDDGSDEGASVSFSTVTTTEGKDAVEASDETAATTTIQIAGAATAEGTLSVTVGDNAAVSVAVSNGDEATAIAEAIADAIEEASFEGYTVSLKEENDGTLTFTSTAKGAETEFDVAITGTVAGVTVGDAVKVDGTDAVEASDETAATAEFTVSVGETVEAGTVTVTVNGTELTVEVTAEDTETTIAEAIVAAINDENGGVSGVTATNSEGTVIIESDSKGAGSITASVLFATSAAAEE